MLYLRPSFDEALLSLVKHYGWKRMLYVYDTDAGSVHCVGTACDLYAGDSVESGTVFGLKNAVSIRFSVNQLNTSRRMLRGYKIFSARTVRTAIESIQIVQLT